MKKFNKKRFLTLVLSVAIFISSKHAIHEMFSKYPHLYYGIDNDSIISYISEDDYLNSSLIPELNYLVPQGITSNDEYLFISLYNSIKCQNSYVYVMNYEGSLVNKVKLDCSSHVGGIAYDDVRNVLWVSGTSGEVRAYSVFDVINNNEVNHIYTNPDVGSDLINYKGQRSVSYLSYDNDKLYVGNFTLMNDGTLKIYDIKDNNGNICLEYESELIVPSKVQGMTFYDYDDAKYILFSRSYGTEYDSMIQGYKYCDDFDYKKQDCFVLRLGAMLEQITVDKNGILRGVFEDNARIYRDDIINDDLFSIDISFYIKKN